MKMQTKEILGVVLIGIQSKLKKMKRSPKKDFQRIQKKGTLARTSKENPKRTTKESPEELKVVINGASNRISEELPENNQ